MKYNNKNIYSLFFVMIVFSAVSLESIAGVLVTPSRVVFEDNMRSAKVTLLNKGDERDTFRISFIRQNMDENGEFHPIETNQDGLYSDAFIRHSPRQITLNPGQSQTVRLLLRKKRGMQVGEYRSHLLIQALPKATASDISNLSNESEKSISVSISTVLGVSLPVIIRNGNLSSSIELRNAKFIPESNNSKAKINFEIHRTGNKSSYGNVTAKYISESGEEKIISYVKGIAVYSNRDMRHFSLNVTEVNNEILKKGHITLTYSESTKQSTESASQTIKVEL